MSTFTIGSNTFAILSNGPDSLYNVALDRGATHFVKVYDGTRAYGGDRVLNYYSSGNFSGDPDGISGGLFHQLPSPADRGGDVLTATRVSEVTGEPIDDTSTFTYSSWNEPDFIPLYLVGSRVPADVAHLMPEVGNDGQVRLSPAYVLPRSASEAITLASQLQSFARWLPGGELESIGHEHARNANLCGEYERIVCPTFGWTPRRGEENSMMRYTSQFFAEMDTFEQAHADFPPLARLQRWMERYESDGFANRAVIEHADAHLENYKRESVAQLLTDTIGWEAGNLSGPTAYEVTVRVERTRTITEVAYIPVTVEADDEGAATDIALDIADADSYYISWDEHDEDISETDREVYEIDPA
jgi:hypothetical protein